jgi:hypothetical protein
MSDRLAHDGARVLRAGPLTLAYEGAGVRWIRYGRHEILRGIYGAVRDAHWRTVPAAVREVTIDAHEDSFRVEFAAGHQHLDVDFHWRGTITGERSGLITFTLDGVARRTFLKNRIGLCVLHPMEECSGRPCAVEHVDGSIASTAFPALVSPHQAFREVRALAHEVVPGVIAELRVEGDVFETEDQRNWSDTSFKTYGTPVDLPFPVEIAAGTPVRQVARLRVRGGTPLRDDVRTGARASIKQPAAGHAARSEEAVRIEVTGAIAAMPRIGLMIDATQPLSARERECLHAIAPSHLRVDLDMAADSTAASSAASPTDSTANNAADSVADSAGGGDPDWRAALREAATQAAAIGTSLQIAALVPDPPQAALKALAEAGAALPVPVNAWLVFDRATGTTPASLLTSAREAFAGRAAGRLGGGSNGHFADLNRHRPLGAPLDLLVYPMSPQAHAVDAETMVENLQAITLVADTARSFTGDVPLMIAPVTLKPRAKPGAPVLPPLAALPDHIDARQMQPFAAAWTVAHLRACAEAGIESVTYFRTVGWDGVMERECGSPMPEAFPSRPGMVFPVYQALMDIGAFAGGRVLLTRSSDPHRVDALYLERDGAQRLLLVNLRADPQRVQLPADLAALAEAAGAPAPLLLAGHATVTLDLPSP